MPRITIRKNAAVCSMVAEDGKERHTWDLSQFTTVQLGECARLVCELKGIRQEKAAA